MRLKTVGEGLAAAMSALPAADAALLIGEKCRELLVSALPHDMTSVRTSNDRRNGESMA